MYYKQTSSIQGCHLVFFETVCQKKNGWGNSLWDGPIVRTLLTFCFSILPFSNSKKHWRLKLLIFDKKISQQPKFHGFGQAKFPDGGSA